MPKQYKRPTQRRPNETMALDGESRRQLLFGRGMFSSTPQLDESTFTSLWNQHGDQLLADWIIKYPCTRPFAWYFCIHNAERPIVAPNVPDDIVQAIREQSLFGFLNSGAIGQWYPPDYRYAGWPAGWGPLQEDQGEYLARHQLLTDAELAALD